MSTSSTPESVIWDTTYACPLRCIHCYGGSGRRAAGQFGHKAAPTTGSCCRAPSPSSYSVAPGPPESTGGYRSVLAWDPALGPWTPAAGAIVGRSGLGVVELADDRVLVAGGVAVTGAAAGSPDATTPARTGEVLIP
ncbi:MULTISPECIES: hypothetical protein [unclassified Streptomyces]|uniref:hypothetical protein n=1 Tax=unclassified Streptomyces TaxID=2593676 RepID=UPI00364D3190